ncbi:hypothetical protein [Salmonella enterica]|uniref:hypothetical protein n=1 Tax=Salmonella enterica TaxID=28901 RepID=UPI001EE89996|nr:hypothetical protein [Salmonella enterica]
MDPDQVVILLFAATETSSFSLHEPALVFYESRHVEYGLLLALAFYESRHVEYGLLLALVFYESRHVEYGLLLGGPFLFFSPSTKQTNQIAFLDLLVSLKASRTQWGRSLMWQARFYQSQWGRSLMWQARFYQSHKPLLSV